MAPIPLRKYTQERLLEAIEMVKTNQLSLNKAAKIYGIPYATLGDKIRGRRPITSIPRRLMSHEEEGRLAQWIVGMSRRGFGQTREDICQKAFKIMLNRPGADATTIKQPSRQWLKNYMKNHPELSVRTPLALGKERALVSRESLSMWFNEMKEYMDSVDISILVSPDRLFNADETGFSLCPKGKKVVACKGDKHVYSLSSNTKTNITVVVCTSAIGNFLPPMMIFPYKKKPLFNPLDDFPKAHFEISPNGWITAEVFLAWMRDVFVKQVENVKKPLCLFVDGHTSHTALLETSNLCRQHNIVLYCLKAHSSHIIQPIDLAFTGSVKVHWEKAVRRHMQETGEAVNIRSFARVLKPAWEAAAVPENGFKGFAASGIYPYNPEKVLSSHKLSPSLNFFNTPPPSETQPSTSGTASEIQPSTSGTALARSTPPPSTSADVDLVRPTPPPPEFENLPSTSTSDDLDVVSSSPQPSTSTGNTHFESSDILMQIREMSKESFNKVHAQFIKDGTFQLPNGQRYKLSCTQLPSASGDYIGDILTLPIFRKGKGPGKKTPSHVMALTGNEYQQVLEAKQQEKEKAIEEKEKRKSEREEKRKKKTEEQAEKKKIREEAKKKREEEKARREQEKARKRSEREAKRSQREAERRQVDESTDSNEDDEDEGCMMVFDDNSSSDLDISDLSEFENLFCHSCKLEKEGL